MTAGARLERRSLVREISATGGAMTVSGTQALVAGFSMALPIFDQNRGEMRRADAERRVAVYERTLVERQVTADVTASYDAVRALSVAMIGIGGDLLSRAEEGRRIAEGAFREGATSILQVLDAARALAEARQVYFQTLVARRQSLIELNAAIGVDDASALLGVPSMSSAKQDRLPADRRNK
jgi:cobalt-zinc-cadmium efflux system outer membrane protein